MINLTSEKMFSLKKKVSKGVVEAEATLLSGKCDFIPIADFDFNGIPEFSFIGGMFYTDKKEFDLKRNLRLRFPFTSYCKFRIPGIRKNGKYWKSLIYSKLPVAVFQMKGKLFAVEFEPVIKSSRGREIVPFISLESKKGKMTASFSVFTRFPMIRKKNLWMGYGNKGILDFGMMKGEKLRFRFRIIEKSGTWDSYIDQYFRKIDMKSVVSRKGVLKNILSLKRAFWRAWDDKHGSFAQLPWKTVPGFALENLTWGLTSYEAINMVYFREYFSRSGDMDYDYWATRLENVFRNGNLISKPIRGRGIIWKELTSVNDKELSGLSYLYTGYAGYPGGQSTIALNLLRYSLMTKTDSLLPVVKQTMEYIISTQNRDGSWPAALLQLPEFPVRSPSYELLKTTGGSAESVRALLLGWKMTGNKKYLSSAMRGLNFLKPCSGNSCIGVNVLRDIGKDEVEGLSALYSVHAFLDAYEILKKKEYLHYAIVWARHMLTWFYGWESKNLGMKLFFHPISQSITPRISPYESVLAVSLCSRLFFITKDKFWKCLAIEEYSRIGKYIEEDGGLCECYFPDWLCGMDSLPVEQTFATAELLNASMQMAEIMGFGLKLKNTYWKPGKYGKIEYRKSDDSVEIIKNSKTVGKFNFKDMVIFIGKRKAFLSFGESYSSKSVIKSSLRGKFIPGFNAMESGHSLSDVIFGIQSPARPSKALISDFSKQKKSNWSAEIISDNPLRIRFFTETGIHRIEGSLEISFIKDRLLFSFSPIEIRILGCGISCTQVLFCVDRGIKFCGDYDRMLKDSCGNCYDITLQTNWTHHGLFKKSVFFEG